MNTLLRALRIWFVGPQSESPWTVAAFMLTVFIMGALLKAAMPQLTGVPIVGALAVAALVAGVAYRAENPVARPALRYNDRACTVEIFSDPPPPRPR